MTKLSRTIVILTTLIVAGTGSRVLAEETTSSSLPGVEQFIAEKLDAVSELPDAQKEKIRGVFHDELGGLQKLARQYTVSHRELLETVRSVTVEEKTIRAQADKVATVMVEYTKKRAELAKQIQGVLTPEQLDKARDQQTDVLAKIAGFVDDIAKRLIAE